MTPKTSADLFARAVAILAAHVPPLVTHQVPAGLAISTPETWSDGDTVALYLVPSGQGLRLVDDGTVVPGLDASGSLPEDGSWRRHLEGSGLSFDEHEYEVFAEVESLEGLPAQALAMARALLSLAGLAEAGD